MESPYNDNIQFVNDIYNNIFKSINKPDLLENLSIVFNDWISHRDFGIRLRGASVEVSAKKITMSQISIELLWYVCLYAYHIIYNDLDRINLHMFLQHFKSIDLQDENLDSISYKDFDSWDTPELAKIYGYSVNYLLCHEIGHFIYRHRRVDDHMNDLPTDVLHNQEVVADSFAMHYVSIVARSYDEYYIGMIGIVAAQALCFWDKTNMEINDEIHGNTMDRINASFEVMSCNTTALRSFATAFQELAPIYFERKYNQ